MNTQYIRLNMVPAGVLPVMHVSQFDIGRPLGVVVYDGSAEMDLTDYTVTIEATRTDGTPITAAVTTDENIGAFVTTATMTNKEDLYLAQLVIVDGSSNRVASLPFMMRVVKAAMDENSEAIEEDAPLYQQYNAAIQALIVDVRADLNAEVTARQNAIAAEAATRAAADNTLQGNINAEALTRASQDAVLSARMDTFASLPSGSTAGNAELLDIRVGADGKTYSTAGVAVRTQISNITNAIGTFTYSQTRTARLMDVPVSVSSGDVVYFKPTRWTGDTYTNIDLYGVNGSTTTRIGRVTSVGDEQFITLTASYSSLRVNVNTAAAPTTQQTLEAIVSVFSDLTTLSDYVFKNKKDILDSAISKGYYPSNQPLLANSETTGAWLLVSARLAQLTDAPSGLSGDYILNVVRFGNGWFQELISLSNASEHRVRFVSSSTRTGAWNSYNYSAAFVSNGYITNTTLTDKKTIGSWLLVSAYVSGLTDAPEGLSGDYVLNVYPFGNGYAQELISLLRPAEKHIRYVMNSTGTGAWHSIYDEQIKIATFGDSITRGQIGGTSPAQYTDSGFVRAGKLKGYEVTNYGIGGIGYSYTINNHNALYEINNASLSNVDIVTLSFGVNDWQNNIPVGTVNDNTISTMCGGMNLAIQKVIEKSPTATIIVFSPLNCTFKGGSASGKWALGQSLATSGTLQNVFDAMKAVCDKYEIAFVDLTHGNPAVNCLNANNTGVLGDGLHPTLNTYKHLGRIIANYI